MSLSESQSNNISINNNDPNDMNLLNAYTQDLKKCFMSLKSENEISKINKRKLQNISRISSQSKSNNNSKNSNSYVVSNIKNKSKMVPKSTTPIEFFCELEDFIKKENENKIEREKEERIIKEKEEKKNNEKKLFEAKRKEKIDLNKKKYDSFWKKVKSYIDKKNEHLSQLTYKIQLRNEQSEKNSFTKIKLNKTSILLYPKCRKPLYIYKNINDKSLNKNLHHFYQYHQKERSNINNSNKSVSKTKKSINYIYNEDEKNYENENRYREFYEQKLLWLKKKEDKIRIRKKYLDKKDKIYMDSFSFKPHIDKQSIKLIKQRNSFLSFLEHKLSTDINTESFTVNKNDIYQKYLVTIKPYMSFYYERNSPFYKRNKKQFITPNKSNKSINIGMIHINKGNNIKLIQEKNTNKEEEKDKDKNINNIKKNIFNIFKPDKKYTRIKNNKEKEENNKENKKDKTQKKHLWWNEINNINNKQNKKGKSNSNYNYGLYKVNVRENSSWNRICINNIVPKRFSKELLYDFL